MSIRVNKDKNEKEVNEMAETGGLMNKEEKKKEEIMKKIQD